MGELTVWNMDSKTLEYSVDASESRRRGLFNDGGAVIALSQTHHFVAAAFRCRFHETAMLPKILNKVCIKTPRVHATYMWPWRRGIWVIASAYRFPGSNPARVKGF
jgi:hypothetical protein